MAGQKTQDVIMTLRMCEWLNPGCADEALIAWGESREWRRHEFRHDVLSLLAKIRATTHSRWALCLENNYFFAVSLLAVFYSGRIPVLPGHFREAVLAEQRHAFDALITDLPLQLDCDKLTFPFTESSLLAELPEWPKNAFLIVFTSGSTGKPQKIIKPVACLERESQWLSARWGEQLKHTQFVATVAPHHLYGLSFAFMLPLSLGLPFYSKSVEYHEQLLTLSRGSRVSVLVSSPAFLKRLDPALESIDLKKVFSAGGPLPFEATRSVEHACGCLPTEIYGTTETGVIAFRQQGQPDEAWTRFEHVEFFHELDGTIVLHSPLIPQKEGVPLSDELRLLPDGQHFHLLGRKDRIVKMAEQRVSLTDIERRLCALEWLNDASAILIEKAGRQSVAAVIVLSDAGHGLLLAQDRNALYRHLRDALRKWLPSVALPRYWRIVSTIPLNRQGKRAMAELQEMFL